MCTCLYMYILCIYTCTCWWACMYACFCTFRTCVSTCLCVCIHICVCQMCYVTYAWQCALQYAMSHVHTHTYLFTISTICVCVATPFVRVPVGLCTPCNPLQALPHIPTTPTCTHAHTIFKQMSASFSCPTLPFLFP